MGSWSAFWVVGFAGIVFLRSPAAHWERRRVAFRGVSTSPDLLFLSDFSSFVFSGGVGWWRVLFPLGLVSRLRRRSIVSTQEVRSGLSTKVRASSFWLTARVVPTSLVAARVAPDRSSGACRLWLCSSPVFGAIPPCFFSGHGVPSLLSGCFVAENHRRNRVSCSRLFRFSSLCSRPGFKPVIISGSQ